jgi:ABC-type transporter MlaC component
MRLIAWQDFLGGSLAALVLFAPAAAPLAQNLVSPLSMPAPISPNPALDIVPTLAPATPKVAAHPATPKPPLKKIAVAKKKPAPKVAAVKQSAPKIAAAKKKPEAVKVAVAATQPAPPSYTITTTSGNVTSTRIVPIPTAAAVADQLVAAATQPPTPPVTRVATPTRMPPPPIDHPAPVAPLAQIAALPKDATPPLNNATASPQPQASTPAVSFVSAFLDKAFHVARDTSLTSLQRRVALADLFGAKMDVSRIAGYTTGNELTTEPTDFQRRFRTILISYLVETYYPRLELASDPSVLVETLPGAVMSDGSAVVWTTFAKSGFGAQSVKWQLVPDGNGYQIVDIFSAGASLVQMERDTFLSVMRDGGLPELMAKLDARTKALASAATE